MNYIEVGLPHSEFVPTKKAFISPSKMLPVSGLSKRYLGLEGMKKTEIASLCDRLSKPKQTQSQELNFISLAENAQKPDRSRFVGKKKMSANAIQSMVDRLSKGKSSDRVPESRRMRSTPTRPATGAIGSYAWHGQVGSPRPIIVNYLPPHGIRSTIVSFS